MKKQTKTLILSIVVTLILLLTFTITYAAFVYRQTGDDNHQLVLGDIWMSYEESNGIDLSGAMPGDDYSEYFEFTISGINTYTKQDIWYDVVLSRGDVPEEKAEDNRILDKYLNFKLVEVNEDDSETIIFTDKTYSDINGKRIHVEVIPKNQIEEYNKTYRLYMTINDKLIIGNTTDAIISTEDYKNAFASIKVSVTGDFKEKEVSVEYTPASCFGYRIMSYENPTVNPVMASQIVLEDGTNELTACINYFSNYIGMPLLEGETWESFCREEGTARGITFQTGINDLLEKNGDFYIWGVSIPELVQMNIVNVTNATVGVNGYDKTCGSDVVIPKTINDSSVTMIGESAFANNQLTSINIPNGVTMIGKSAFANNQLTSINIPNSVTIIRESAFANNQLTNLTFEENSTLADIDINAFSDNRLTSINIPNSVTIIRESAFANNQLEEIIIGNGIQEIGSIHSVSNELKIGGVFQNNPNLKSLRIDRTCSNIKNIPSIYLLCGIEQELFAYPWLSSEEPYTQAGVTVYGSDGVCDTF